VAAGLAALAVGLWMSLRAPSVPAGADLEGFEAAHRAVLQPGTPPATTTPLRQAEGDWRVALRGGLRFEHTGQELGPDLLLEHGLLRLGAGEARLLGRAGDGRWVFTQPDGLGDGEGLQLRIDTDPLVERYLLSPSEARRALTGAVTVELLRRPRSATGLAAGGPALGVGLVLVAPSLLVLGLRRRLDRLERSEELVLRDRIERRLRRLRGAGEPGLRRRLESARQAARTLAARCVQQRTLLAEVTGTDAADRLAGALSRGIEALRRIDAAVADVVAGALNRELSEAAAEVEQAQTRSLAALAALTREAAAVQEASVELKRLERAAGVQMDVA